MQVDRIRSSQSDSVDSVRSRGNGSAPGFSELMDSVLGPADGAQPARTGVAETNDDKPSAERSSLEVRDTTVGARQSRRGKDRESTRADELAVKSGTMGSEREVVDATAREDEARRGDDASGELASTLAADLVASPVAQALEPITPFGIPFFEALARGSEAEAAADEGISELAPDLDFGDAASRSVGAGALSTTDAGGLAEAATARAAIVDPRAREALRAALAQALDARDGKAAALEGEGDPIAPTAPEVDEVSAVPNAPSIERGSQRPDSLARAEFAPAHRTLAAEANGARSQSDPGGDDPSRSRDAALARAAAGPAPQRTPESSAIAAAAIEGATAGLVETASGVDETAASNRLVGPAAANVAPAPELPPATATARAYAPAAPEAIAVQAEWLATRGGGTARLVLNPPELGEIAIRVTVRQQAVEVVMVAQTALAHSMAEDQGDRLSQAFASRDLRLDQFEVRRGDPSEADGTGHPGASDAGARERDRARDERAIDRRSVGGRGAGRAARGGDFSPPPPRIESNRNAAGIDLRI